METWMIVILVILVVVGVAIFAFNPIMNRKESEAAREVKESLGDDVEIIEARAVGFDTDSDVAGGLRGMGVLAANASTILFVTWAPRAQFSIDRSSVTSVSSPVEAVEDANKAMIEITYMLDGEPVVASFRVPDPTYWLTTLSVD